MAIIFAAVGAFLMTNSKAATGDNTIEPENGTISLPAVMLNDSNASGSKAVKFASSGAINCAISSQHVPDGPDGMGGCWPGPSNTGPNQPESSMVAYTGSINDSG